MSKQVVSVVVGLVFASSAFGQVPGEVVSYHCPACPGGIFIDKVPAGGLVVTDIAVGSNPGGHSQLTLYEGSLPNVTPKVRITLGPGFPGTVHFQSGIAFLEGTPLTMDTWVGGSSVTISGYIPCPAPCQSAGAIPAVGSFGQAVMVLALVVVGSLLLRRREDTKLA